ncbi:MAG: extracellular solute-binding protein [Deltaproteobacteria bacterium]|nr:extracellular solute-binding protein [Deltaproteobacteria bacterium]
MINGKGELGMMNKPRRGFRRFVLCLFCLALMSGPFAVMAASDPKVVDGARKEGKVTWYATTNVQDARPFISGFNQKYPFVQVELLRLGSSRAVNKVATEARAGTFSVDVLNVNDVEATRLAERGMFLKYQSPEIKYYPRHLTDSDGHWLPFKTLPHVIGYNSRLVPAKEAPSSFEDLLDKKWRGKIMMDPEDFRLYSGFIQVWGKERARKYLDTLSRQEIQWRPGHSLLAQVLAAGEAPIALIFAHHAEILRSKGAPVDWDNRLDPIFLSANVNFIAARAPHPNAAKLFVDFTLSKEAQMILADSWRITPHPEVPPKTRKLDPKYLKMVLIRAMPDEILQEHVEEWRKIFKLR